MGALEWHLRPRPQSLWPADAAVAGHDAMLAASGITTVLDSWCVGDLGGDGFRADTLRSALHAIISAQTNGTAGSRVGCARRGFGSAIGQCLPRIGGDDPVRESGGVGRRTR